MLPVANSQASIIAIIYLCLLTPVAHIGAARVSLHGKDINYINMSVFLPIDNIKFCFKLAKMSRFEAKFRVFFIAIWTN